MKKIFTIFLILFLSISAVIASGENYYRYESNLDVKFVPLNVSLVGACTMIGFFLAGIDGLERSGI